MSEMSALSELAALAARPAAGKSEPASKRRRPLAGARMLPAKSGQRHGVGELLGLVLTLSARTRRAGLPPVFIDLDVFSPDGHRSVQIAQQVNGEW